MENTSQNDFELWVFEMDDEIKAFLSENVAGIAEQLDHSEDSLDVLESWMLAEYASVEALQDPSQQHVLDRVARYIGETIRKKYNLKWKLETEKREDTYYGLPVITDERGENNYECPHAIATITVRQRKPGHLRTVFQAVMR
jgi:hypothetical protein